MGRMVRETTSGYWHPYRKLSRAKVSRHPVDHFQINPAVANRTEEIEKVLKEHELLITEWSPIHLAKMMNDWFWKDGATAVSALDTWQKTCATCIYPDYVIQHVASHSKCWCGFSRLLRRFIW